MQQWVSRCFSPWMPLPLASRFWCWWWLWWPFSSDLCDDISRVYTSRPYWPSSGNPIRKVIKSSTIVCDIYLDSRFSSTPFLCNVAMKSVSGLDIRNCISNSRPANTNGSCAQNTMQLKYNHNYLLINRNVRESQVQDVQCSFFKQNIWYLLSICDLFSSLYHAGNIV